MTASQPAPFRAAAITLALLLAVGAFFFPARSVEVRRRATIERLQADVAAEKARMEPGDDSHIDPVNTPYPIDAGNLFRALLCVDCLLLVLAATANRRAVAPANPPAFLTDVRRDWPILTGLTVLAAALRIIGIGRDLWIDEITTLVRHVRAPLSDIFLQATSSNNHLLNSVLAHFSIQIFGEREWALRLPAILFGIATIPLLYLLVRRFSPRFEATLAAATLALSYHHVFFSTDARGYSGMIFGGLLGTLALMEALESNSNWDWLLFCIGMIVCVASVATGAVVLAAQFVVIGLLRPSKKFFTMFALVCLALLHAYAFLIADIAGFIFGDYRRPEAGWHLSAALAQIVLRGLGLGPVAIPVLLSGSLVIIIGIWSFMRQAPAFALLLLVPELLMFVAVVGLGAGIYPRFFLYGLPAAIVFTSRGIARLKDALPVSMRRWGQAVAFAAMLVASVFLLRTWWRYPKQDYSGARRYILEHRHPDDAIVAVGIAGEGYRYYWPEIVVSNRVTEIRQMIEKSPRLWLVYSFPDDMRRRRPILLDFVKRNLEEVGVFPGMVVDGELRVCLITNASSGSSQP
jgi:mannosyltransferase